MRPMAFAGNWYPREAARCIAAIEGFRGEAAALGAGENFPRLGVVPHAGWVFSGALAGRVFAQLGAGCTKQGVQGPEIGGVTGQPGSPQAAQLVIVLGGHLGASQDIVAMEGGRWQTPLGPLQLHTGFHASLKKLGRVRWESASQRSPDNSVEVQLPFVKYWFPEAEVLALRVPPSAVAVALGRALVDYLGQSGLATVAVASTDLTHYGPAYNFQPQGHGAQALEWVRRENDPAFITALAAGVPEDILSVSRSRQNACSAGATAALAVLAGAEGARFSKLGYATSADVLPKGENFVGYVGGVYQ